MTAIVAITAARTGTVTTGTAVTASDTIDLSLLGSYGGLLEIINGNASPDTVTISDASTTAQNAPAAAISKSVVNATSQVFKVVPQQADPTTGKITVTHSVTSTVTYKYYPFGI